MTSVESSKTSRDLDCEICNTPFDTKNNCPRILAKCGHTICEECANKLWQQGDCVQVKCPFDRIVTEVQGDIKNLPKNFTLDRLLDAQIPTGRCSKDLNHEAWFTCKECDVDFCESCFDNTHYKCEKTEKWYPEKLSNNEKSIQAPKCQKHPANYAHFICQDSSCQTTEKTICSSCLLGDHEYHKNDSYKDVVAENLKTLKETIIPKAVLKKTEPYLDCDIPKYRDSYKSEENEEYTKFINDINSHYDNQKAAAIKKFKDLVEKKLEKAEELCEEHEDAKSAEKTLVSVRSEIRGRLTMKNELDDVEDLVERHRLAYEELNRDRDTPLLAGIDALRLKFPSVELEIIDPDELALSRKISSDKPTISRITRVPSKDLLTLFSLY